MKGRIVGTRGICFKPKVCTVGARNDCILFGNKTSFTFGLGGKWCRHLSRMVTYFPLSLSLSLHLTLTHSPFFSHSFSLSLTLFYLLSLSRSLSLSLSLTLALSLLLSLSLGIFLSHLFQQLVFLGSVNSSTWCMYQCRFDVRRMALTAKRKKEKKIFTHTHTHSLSLSHTLTRIDTHAYL